MKFARMIAVAVALLLVATGCNRNRDNTSPAASGVIPDVGSRIEEGAEDLRSDVEEGMYDFRSDIEEGAEDLRSGYEDLHSGLDDERSRPYENPHVPNNGSTLEEESVAPAMSTDFSEIGALDATLENGFPGGPVDAQNRPSGPISYQQKYGKYDAHFIVPTSKKIYLTFDEGYENGYTSRILDILKEKNVKVVFFITYDYAKSEPELVKRMIAEGHTIGNHSTAHKVFPEMTLQDAQDDIMKLHNYVKAQFGYEMSLFRPPEGCFSEQTLALAESLGYKTVLWSFTYKDYDTANQPISVEAIDTIVSKAHPGEIALLHAVSKTNTEILGDVIDRLQAEGYEFANYFGLQKTAQ